MPKLIFVHGRNATGRGWNGLEEHPTLVSEFPETAAVTLAGHTQAAFPAGAPHPSSQEWCAQFLPALATPLENDVTMDNYVASVTDAFPPVPAGLPVRKDVVLIGHSMGGAVISKVAEHMPERISRLIYVSAMLPSHKDSVDTLSAKIAITGPALPWGICEDFRDYLPGIGSDLVLQPSGPLSQEITLSEAFDGLKKTYIHCLNDKIIPKPAQDAMLGGHANLSTKTLTAGHLPQFQDRHGLAGLLVSILKE